VWFKMAPGAERITVERQEFATEITGDDGSNFFRAPDHFAPRILSLGGFTLASNLPANAPADLPKADPSRDDAIRHLAATQEAQQEEIASLRADLLAAEAESKAVMQAKIFIEGKLAEALAKIQELEDELDEKPAPSTAPKAAAK